MIKWATISAAVLGIPVALWAIAASTLPAPDLPPDAALASNPFPRGIASPGAVEASTRNVRVAVPEPGRIARVFVEVNDTVKLKDPLFQLEPVLVEAELAKVTAGVEVARRDLLRLRALPRPEELARVQAALDHATARVEHARRERDRAQRIRSRGRLSEQEFAESGLTLDEATSAQTQAQAELDRVRGGAWSFDLALAEARLSQVQADVESVRARLDRLTVRSPIAGRVLKRYLEPGEFAEAGDHPAIVVGDVSILHIRAQVDERDSPRLRDDCQAVAFVPGRAGRPRKLGLLRIEPLAVPKNQFTASNSELVDTRVIEVLFRLEPPSDSDDPLFPGQIVDVFIDAANAP